MRPLGLRHGLGALLLALAVNATSLLVVVEVNEHVRPRRREPQAEVRSIALSEPPKRRHRRKPTRQPLRVRPRAVPLPVPDLPAAVSAGSLSLAGVGPADLFGELPGEEADLDADLVLREEAVDEPPRVVSRVAPEYPAAAERQGVEGHVVLRLRVSASGFVEQVRVVGAEPPGVFEAAAERAVRRYRFLPARYRGQPVAVLCRQKLIFRLED